MDDRLLVVGSSKRKATLQSALVRNVMGGHGNVSHRGVSYKDVMLAGSWRTRGLCHCVCCEPNVSGGCKSPPIGAVAQSLAW